MSWSESIFSLAKLIARFKLQAFNLGAMIIDYRNQAFSVLTRNRFVYITSISQREYPLKTCIVIWLLQKHFDKLRIVFYFYFPTRDFFFFSTPVP